MTEEESAEPPRTSAREPGAIISAVRIALLRGGAAFVAIALVGQVLGVVDALAIHRPNPPSAFFARLGWFEFGLINGVPLRFEGGGLGLGAGAGLGSARLEVGAALLLGTWLAAWLLYRGGRAVADAMGGGAVRRVVAGTAVAPVYAVPSFVLSLVVTFPLRLSNNAVFAGAFQARSDPVRALVLPLAIGIIAGAAGGLSSARSAMPEDRLAGRTSAVIGGGWRMFGLGLALAYAGLVLAGAVRPDGAAALVTPTTGRYFRAAFEHPRAGWAILVHHVAVSPDEALWTLVPAMGGCDALQDGRPRAFLCYGRFPRRGPERLGLASLLGARSVFGLRYGRAPIAFFLFLLVPAAAAPLGGAWTARHGPQPSWWLGCVAGAVFALLVVAVGYLASLTIDLDTSLPILRSASYRIGPELASGGLIALAWGVVGGGVGAALGARGAVPPSG